MKASLDHLPEMTRQELERVLEILFRAFEEATRGKGPRKQGKILKVLLFGSRARGEGVDDPVGRYTSDLDVLVVVDNDELTDVAEYWSEADAKLQQAFEITHELSAPVHFIVHSISDVNDQLTRGRPFFTDLARDAVPLFELDGHPFAKAAKLSPEAAYAEAQANFDQWFPSATNFFDLAREADVRGMSNEAAFLLHQAAERFYHCALLTMTLYTAKSHNLNFLRAQAERVAPELMPAWPRSDRFEKRAWELLRRAYVEARFSAKYAISGEELAFLVDRISELQRRVERSCREYLEQIRSAPKAKR